jgi:hypothetical protein
MFVARGVNVAIRVQHLAQHDPVTRPGPRGSVMAPLTDEALPWPVIAANLPYHPTYQDGSFVERLTEEGLFAWDLWWPLEREILELQAHPGEDPMLAEALFRIFSRLTHLLTSHADAADLFEITGVPDEELREWAWRMRRIFEHRFAGVRFDLTGWVPRNPLLPQG